jgi:Transposase DDE domain
MFTTAPLFGRFHSSLKQAAAPLRQQPLHHLESLLQDRLDPALLALNPDKTNSRQGLYFPKLTFLGFLDQTLNADSSCRQAVRQIMAYYQKQPDPKHLGQATSAYCQARARWSLDELIDIRRHLADHTCRNPLALQLPPRAPALKVVDGSCLNLPDTPLNRQAYPQSQDQQPQCGLPLLRLVTVFSLQTGALLERAYGPYTTSENALYQQLWPTFQTGDVIVGDRNFGSWAALASFKARQVDGLFRLHASRNKDFRQGHYLGLNDRLVSWAKPKDQAANLTPQQWQALPATLTVRLVRFRVPTSNGRSKKIVLVTTLTDPLAWPLNLLAALYGRRWQIELFLDDIKTTLHLDMLSCLTPAMAHKELEMHLIAYNLIRSIMAEAACICHVPLGRLSFKGTLDTARQYSLILAQVPPSYRKRRRAIYADMLAVIAQDQVPERPDRFEPRCLKRRPKRYPFMNRPRHELRAAHVDHLPARKRPTPLF